MGQLANGARMTINQSPFPIRYSPDTLVAEKLCPRVEEFLRIHGLSVDARLVVQMRAG